MLDFLLTAKGYLFETLDGSMDLEQRTSFLTKSDKGTKKVDDFNNNPSAFVFLISTKAGGVGLNIVSANKVYVFTISHLT